MNRDGNSGKWFLPQWMIKGDHPRLDLLPKTSIVATKKSNKKG